MTIATLSPTYRKTKDGNTKVSFPNGKAITFTAWDSKQLKFLLKESQTIQYLYNKTASLPEGPLNNTQIPTSLESTATLRHWFYIALRNTLAGMTRHGYSLQELIKLEKIVLAETINKDDLLEYKLEREELADVIRYRQYR